MALIKTDSQNYTNIANAIRTLNGSTQQYKPDEMAEALSALSPDCAVSFDTFDSDGNVLTATTYGSVVRGLQYKTKLTSVNIDSAATTIGERAFEQCGLTSFTVPENITHIEDYAFYFANLKNVIFHNNITDIGIHAFCGCALVSVEIPESVTEIKRWAFSYNEFTTLFIPSNIQVIGYRGFANCSYLANVTFEGTPTFIDTDVFADCSKLTTINVPWAEGEISNAPWGATNATINYNYIAG